MKRLLTSLKAWDKNPRGIKKADFKRLKRLIIKLGIFKPFVITEDGTVLGGNMRLRAVRELIDEGKLDLTEVPVTIVDAPTEDKKIEYALADNDRVGYYEDEALAELLQDVDIDLGDYKVDLGQPVSLDKLLEQFGPDIEEDEAPDVEDGEPDSKYGEVYQLGRHRLMCGDATKIEDVEKLMDGKKADMVFTDPPYNTGMQGKADSTRLNHMFDDSYTDDEFKTLILDGTTNMVSYTKGEAVFYVCIDWRNMGYIKELIKSLIPVSNVIVWDKMVHGLGSDYKYTYEMIIVAKKGNPKIENRIGEDYRDIWHVQRKVGKNKDHATAKPISLCVKPIKHASKQDDIVLDLFGGSGSTLIACEQTNRTCYMSELDPKYVDVIRKRYWKFVNDTEEGWQDGTKAI